MLITSTYLYSRYIKYRKNGKLKYVLGLGDPASCTCSTIFPGSTKGSSVMSLQLDEIASILSSSFRIAYWKFKSMSFARHLHTLFLESLLQKVISPAFVSYKKNKNRKCLVVVVPVPWKNSEFSLKAKQNITKRS